MGCGGAAALLGGQSRTCHLQLRCGPGGEIKEWPLPEPIGSLALRKSGGAVVALKSGFHLFDFATAR